MVAYVSPRDGSLFSTSRPSAASMSFGSAPCNGDEASAAPRSITFLFNCEAAANTADPTLAAVSEPAEIGARGSVVSP